MSQKRDKGKMEPGESADAGSRREDAMGPIPLARAPDFRKTYVTRTTPFITDFDVRIVVANEAMETEEGWCTIADGMLILTPIAAKELAGDLQAVVQSWEEFHGKIKGRTKQRILAEFKREGD
jgi:hypothetical protein